MQGINQISKYIRDDKSQFLRSREDSYKYKMGEKHNGYFVVKLDTLG